MPTTAQKLLLLMSAGGGFLLDATEFSSLTLRGAYSTRRLTASYTGNALRLRRSSDNAEMDFGFIGENLDVDAIATWLDGDEGYLVTWYDQSGNSRDGSIATAGSQPRFHRHGEKNQPVIKSDGTDDYIVIPDAVLTSLAAGTLFMVGRKSDGGEDTLFGMFSTTPAERQWLYRLMSGDNIEFFVGGTSTARRAITTDTYNWTNAHVLGGKFADGSPIVIYVDGSEPTAYTAQQNAATLLSSFSNSPALGRWNDATNTSPARFEYAEVLVFDSELSDANRNTIENNQTNYWLGAETVTNLSPSSSQISANGYAARRTNGMAYRDNALASYDASGTVYQAVCFWDNDGDLNIGTRQIGGAWTLHKYDNIDTAPAISITGADDHRTCVLGIDPDGFIHIAYDMHGEALNYRVSSNAIATFDGTLSAEQSMLGTNEAAVGYPVFFNAPDGTLYFMFRDGSAGNADTYFYSYDEGTTTWTAAAGTGTAGLLLDGKTDLQNAYHYTPAFDSDFGSGGYMHVAWHWRSDGGDGDTNSKVSYVRWDGTNWTQSDGSAQTVPIRESNGEVVDNVAEGYGLVGRNSIASDNNGNPHVVYGRNDAWGDVQVFHTWHNGSSWQTDAITAQSGIHSPGDPPDDNYMPPDIAIETDGTAHVLYCGYGDQGIYVLSSSDYNNWLKSRLQAFSAAVDEYAPSYDPERWRVSGIISMAVTVWNSGDAVTADSIDLVEWTP